MPNVPSSSAAPSGSIVAMGEILVEIMATERGQSFRRPGTLIGALIIGVINNGMNLLSVPYFYQLIVKGIVILVAVCIDVQTKKRHA